MAGSLLDGMDIFGIMFLLLHYSLAIMNDKARYITNGLVKLNAFRYASDACSDCHP